MCVYTKCVHINIVTITPLNWHNWQSFEAKVEGVWDMQPQNMPLWYIDYFEPKALEKQTMQKSSLLTIFYLKQAIKFLMRKSLSVAEREYLLEQTFKVNAEISLQKQTKIALICHYTSPYSSWSHLHYLLLLTQNLCLNTFLQKSIVPLSKICKNFLLWSLLQISIFYERTLHTGKNLRKVVWFLFCQSIYKNLIFGLSQRT